jgi:hypothetical protein
LNTRIIIALVTLFSATHINAQLGYLRKGALYVQGNVSDQGIYKNNRQLIFTENGIAVTYTPEQIEEYGFVTGDTYIGRTVQNGQTSANYFLLRLVSGERTLYELKEKRGSRFFIEHHNSLVEIINDISLKDQLSRRLKPCGSNQSIVGLATYGKAPLTRATWLTNNCYTGIFPTLRKGVFAGYEFSSQSLRSDIDHISVQASSSTPSIGVFLDVPLGMSTSWLMNIQAAYQQINFDDLHVDKNSTLEYQYNFSALGFPLLLKYRGSALRWRDRKSVV